MLRVLTWESARIELPCPKLERKKYIKSEKLSVWVFGYLKFEGSIRLLSVDGIVGYTGVQGQGWPWSYK